MKIPVQAIIASNRTFMVQNSLLHASYVAKKTVITVQAQQVQMFLMWDYEIPASIPNVPQYIMSSVHSASGIRHWYYLSEHLL